MVHTRNISNLNGNAYDPKEVDSAWTHKFVNMDDHERATMVALLLLIASDPSEEAQKAWSAAITTLSMHLFCEGFIDHIMDDNSFSALVQSNSEMLNLLRSTTSH